MLKTATMFKWMLLLCFSLSLSLNFSAFAGGEGEGGDNQEDVLRPSASDPVEGNRDNQEPGVESEPVADAEPAVVVENPEGDKDEDAPPPSPPEVAVTAKYEDGYNLQQCDAKEEEIRKIQKEIFDLNLGNSQGNLQTNNTEHDSAMAELLILKGIKDMIEKHKRFTSDVTDPKNYPEDLSEINKLDELQNNLKSGIDNMNHMLVFQDMVTELIGSEPTDLDNLKNEGGTANIEQFKNVLKKKCENKTIKEMMNNKLCYALNPISSKRKIRKAFIDEEAQKTKEDIYVSEGKNPSRMEEFKAQNPVEYERLEKIFRDKVNRDADSAVKNYFDKKTALQIYSGNIDKMITGFGEAFILSDPIANVIDTTAPDEEQKSQRETVRMSKLIAYQDMFKKETSVPGPSPDDMLDDAMVLDQNLSIARESSDLVKTANMGTLTKLSIEKSIDDYKKCLSDQAIDRFNKKTNNNDCSFNIQKYLCSNHPSKSDCHYDQEWLQAAKDETGGSTDGLILAQQLIKKYQDNVKMKFNSGVNGLIEKLHGDKENTSRLLASNIVEGIDDDEVLKLKVDESKNARIKKEYGDLLAKTQESIDSGLKNSFHAFLSQMDVFEQRQELFGNLNNSPVVFDDDYKDDKDPKKKKEIKRRKRRFLGALKSAGCLDLNLNEEKGLDNAFDKVFAEKEDFDIARNNLNSQDKANGQRNSLKKSDHKLEMKDDFIKKCRDLLGNGESLDDKISKLEKKVVKKKEAIKQIKESQKYKDLNNLSLLAITDYQDKCKRKKDEHAGVFNINRCNAKYEQGHLKDNSVELLISHSGKILNIVEADEKYNLPKYLPELRGHTRGMMRTCEDEDYKDRFPEICKVAKRASRVAESKTKSEAIRDLHRNNHIYFDNQGNMIAKKKQSKSGMLVNAVGYGIVKHAVPLWGQYSMNKTQMQYNEALGYNQKVYNYMIDNPQYWSGYGSAGGWGSTFPFGSFGGGYPISPYMINYSNYNVAYYNI